MIISFELGMPSNNSWNGKWSGEESRHVVVENIRAEKRTQKLVDKGYWSYNFGDGWVASVTATKVDAKQARRLRKQSSGFCGYNWMIRSIKMHDEIRTD